MREIGPLRRSKKARIILVIVLIMVVAVIGFLFEKTRWMMIGAGVLLLTALGLEATNTDLDLGKLMRTGSVSESRIERDEKGNLIMGSMCGDAVYNCDDFVTQQEAQETFEYCSFGEGNDPHRIDGDNDGIAYEGLKNAE